MSRLARINMERYYIEQQADKKALSHWIPGKNRRLDRRERNGELNAPFSDFISYELE